MVKRKRYTTINPYQHQALKKVSLVLIALLMILSLAACVEKEAGAPLEAPLYLSLVIGNHANSKKPNVESPEVTGMIQQATERFGFASIVSVDGSPSLVRGVTISRPKMYLAKSKLSQIASDQASQIIASLALVKAENEEVDTLSALEMAVRSFSSAPEECEKNIIVLDSGIPTSGMLSFLEHPELIQASASDIADWLELQKAIPDFTGISVTWMGLGDVAYPQKELNGIQRDQLEAVWADIIKRTGGTVAFLKTLQGSDIAPDDYPTVTPIDFPSDEIARPEAVSQPAILKPIVFDKKQVEFIGDTAQYKYPKKVDDVLQPVADYLNNYSNFEVLLVGTTASGTKARCQILSEARAQALKDTLISLGVSQAQIQAVGMGYDDPWHVEGDRAEDGTYIEPAASQNRKVVLLDANSEEAQAILYSLGRGKE